jgi:hypothetical protein
MRGKPEVEDESATAEQRSQDCKRWRE